MRIFLVQLSLCAAELSVVVAFSDFCPALQCYVVARVAEAAGCALQWGSGALLLGLLQQPQVLL